MFVFVFVFVFLCRQSWGHRRNMQLKDVLSMDELIETLVITVRWEFYTDLALLKLLADKA